MSQSSLVTETKWAHESNYSAWREEPIHGIALHHTAGTSLDAAANWFANPNSNASAHYIVQGNRICQCVKEEYTAWSVGQWLGNNGTISIEVVNSSTGGDWPVSKESMKTTQKLIADIAKRNNLGKLWINPDAMWPTLAGHRDYSATICPGDYQYSYMQEYADKANEINNPPAQKAELKWSKLSKTTVYQTTKKTYLYDFNHTHATNVKKVKDFEKGQQVEIYGTCENKTIGKKYYVTEYSFTRKIANGFIESNMAKYEAPKPQEQEKDTEVVAPLDGSTGEVENNPRGLTDAEYAKVYEEFLKRTKDIEDKAKEQNIMIPMSNKVYDVLKIVAIVILPLISAVYVALSKIWGFGFGTEIDQTIQIIIAAINTILGLALVKSSADYAKKEDK